MKRCFAVNCLHVFALWGSLSPLPPLPRMTGRNSASALPTQPLRATISPLAFEKFKELVEKKSDGRISVQIFPQRDVGQRPRSHGRRPERKP